MDIKNHCTNNMLLVAPKDMPNCDTVSATMMIEDEIVTIATFWKPTPQELELLNSNGYVVLYVYGKVHPPVAIGTSS